MVIETARFGAVEIQGNNVITFPDGLFGFEDTTSYVVLSHRKGGTTHFLQAILIPIRNRQKIDSYSFSPETFFTRKISKLRYLF